MKRLIAICAGLAAFGAVSPAFAAPEPPGPIDGPATVQTSVPRPPEACLQHRTGGPELPEGEYVEYPSLAADGVTGTTRWGIMPCGPVSLEQPVVVEPPARVELPATGLTQTLLVGIAIILVSAGVLFRLWVRENKG